MRLVDRILAILVFRVDLAELIFLVLKVGLEILVILVDLEDLIKDFVEDLMGSEVIQKIITIEVVIV